MNWIGFFFAAGALLLSSAVAAHDTIAPGAKVSIVFEEK